MTRSFCNTKIAGPAFRPSFAKRGLHCPRHWKKIRSASVSRTCTCSDYSRNLCLHIRHFLDDRFDAGAIQIHKLNPGDITAFLLRYVKTVKRITAKSMTTALRAFFRYLRLWGEIDANLAEFIPRIADWRLSELPNTTAKIFINKWNGNL